MVRKCLCHLFKFIAVFGCLLAVAGPAPAAEPVVFSSLVDMADKRQGFVAILAPSVTRHCMRAVWGQTPPRLLRKWAETLLLDDLANRAQVQRGAMSRPEAVALRRDIFLSLEQLDADSLEVIAIYTSSKPGGTFGRDLTRVMDCQYKALAQALGGRDGS